MILLDGKSLLTQEEMIIYILLSLYADLDL